MKAQDIKALSEDQLKAELLKLRKEQMNLRFQKAMGQMEQPNRWREVRKTIARVKTEMSARPQA
tara:strand:- start:264 stop:455 length:192 start_codon:yes stop_codon:yes gene_type:complete